MTVDFPNFHPHFSDSIKTAENACGDNIPVALQSRDVGFRGHRVTWSRPTAPRCWPRGSPAALRQGNQTPSSGPGAGRSRGLGGMRARRQGAHREPRRKQACAHEPERTGRHLGRQSWRRPKNDSGRASPPCLSGGRACCVLVGPPPSLPQGAWEGGVAVSRVWAPRPRAVPSGPRNWASC